MPGYASAHEGQNSFETANLSTFLVFSALIYLIFTNDVEIHLVPSTVWMLLITRKKTHGFKSSTEA